MVLEYSFLMFTQKWADKTSKIIDFIGFQQVIKVKLLFK